MNRPSASSTSSMTPRSLPLRSLIGAAALALTLALSGCGGAENPSDETSGQTAATRSVDTAFGPVEIPAAPQRAIALEGGVGPLLGADITPVATADGDYADAFLPEEYEKVKDLPLILGADGVDFEKIASLQPDLMIGFVRGGKEEELSAEAKAEWEKLNAIAPTVLIRSDGSSRTKDATLAMSEALGDGEDAQKAKEAYETKAAEIKKEYADVLAEHTFAPMDYYEEVNVYSPISWPGDTLTDAGAKLTSVSADVQDENATFLSAEQLGQVDDATVVLHEQTVDGEPGVGAQELQALPTYKTLPAVEAGNDYGLDYFFADRYDTALKSLESFENTLRELS